ncbi:hypothetical protein [Anaerophaga thermohalophila]|uniref:hypothetical protein n=1 Tax=Anaerophaga thermohalophila TaxID=177400 RepID=UPI000237BE9D|nr:hypothetical protein [Anaerophaga thermohalophila]
MKKLVFLFLLGNVLSSCVTKPSENLSHNPADKLFEQLSGIKIKGYFSDTRTTWLLVLIAYVMLWRNADTTHFFSTYPGHSPAADFKKFVSREKVWLLEDWNRFKKENKLE